MFEDSSVEFNGIAANSQEIRIRVNFTGVEFLSPNLQENVLCTVNNFGTFECVSAPCCAIGAL